MSALSADIIMVFLVGVVGGLVGSLLIHLPPILFMILEDLIWHEKQRRKR